MRILYLSCHSILEHDEIKLFNELGHYVFSPGAYVEPKNPGDMSLRPGLRQIVYDLEDLERYNAIQVPDGTDRKDKLTKEFVDRFDLVINMHIPRWIKNNWDAIKHKPVVWRTIGQSISGNEKELSRYRELGMMIVRYSPMEFKIPSFIGSDAVIRFYKDPGEFSGYNGKDKFVMTANQSLPLRGSFCNYDFWKEVTDGFPRKLYGPGNETAGYGVEGKVEYDVLKKAMQDNRVYLYLGTHPASYTLNFIEAFMTGMPMICPGKGLGNSKFFPGHDLYEITDFITHGENGFITDNAAEARSIIASLLEDHQLCLKIGNKARSKAVELFGKSQIKEAWNEFLKRIW